MSKMVNSDGVSGDFFGQAVAIDGGWAVFGAPWDDDGGSKSGSAYVFRAEPDYANWVQDQKLTAADAGADDEFGFAVDMDGTVVAVGAPFEDNVPFQSGAAYVFEKNQGGGWVQTAKLTAPDAAPGDLFGYAVSVSGNAVLVSANRNDDNGADSGSAYIFRKPEEGGGWAFEAKLTASDAAAADFFGQSVSLDGDVALISSHWDDDLADKCGAAYVFRRDASGMWHEEAKLRASDGTRDDNFGRDLCLHGPLAVMGAWQDGDATPVDLRGSGSAYVFRYNPATQTWSQEAKLVASDRTMGAFFGISVAVHGETVAVGAYQAPSDAGPVTGAAYVFRYVPEGGFWYQQSKLVSSDIAFQDEFGYEIDVSGGAVLVGAHYDDDNGINSGSGYLFGTADGDTDGDGLPDCWEALGIDADDDGVVDLDLRDLASASPDPFHKDIYVEADFMMDRGPAGDIPSQAVADAGLVTGTVLDRVVDSFLRAPVSNPSGRDGINLHIEVDHDLGLPVEWGTDAWPFFDDLKAAFFGTDAQQQDPNSTNILDAKRKVFRYCIFADRQMGSNISGRAEQGGNDFMILLGGFTTPGGTTDQLTGTFMHELGHTLGLHHGGGQDDASQQNRYNYKPNYHSVMNYHWQIPRTWQKPGSWQLDYSRIRLPDLNETALFDCLGLGAPVGFYVDYVVPFNAEPILLNPVKIRMAKMSVGPIDWDDDGMTPCTSVAVDINHINSAHPTSPGDILQGYNDWANLDYNFRDDSDYADGAHDIGEQAPELTLEELEYWNSALPPYGFGDCDGDGDLDLADFACLSGCLAGPGATPNPPPPATSEECLSVFDRNRDGDVDLQDFAGFQEMFGQ